MKGNISKTFKAVISVIMAVLMISSCMVVSFADGEKEDRINKIRS